MYIDELVGKGLEWYVILELIFYAGTGLVPMALPLAVLLASLMSFGNMGENNELVAIKSAGISIQRAMIPVFAVVILTGAGAFYFSNTIWPVSNLKFATLLYDIRHKKPAIDIKPGMFYKGIDGYVIRVGGKAEDGITLYDLSIYDHTKKQGATTVIKAKEGKMQISDDERYLVLTLYNGGTYNEVKAGGNKLSDADGYFPLFRNKFDEQIIRFDLEGFSLERTKDELFKDNYRMLNVSQLSSAEDTIALKIETRKRNHLNKLFSSYSIFKDSLNTNDDIALDSSIFLDTYSVKQKATILSTAISLSRSQKTYAKSGSSEIRSKIAYALKYKIEWHRKFVMGAACIALFLIGAPLGAIIRKGGLGLPIIISVLGFLVQYISMMVGEKMVKQGAMDAFSGMWLSIFILTPIGLFLTYKSTTDSAIMDSTTYVKFIKKIAIFLKLKKNNISETQ
jgi:lipopolysaccharide export system permease protein